MNGGLKRARRYHWHSVGLKSFVDEPHAAIEGPGQGEIVNLTDHRAEMSRGRQLELLGALGPDGIARELAKMTTCDATRDAGGQPLLPHFDLPAHHDVRADDIVEKRLYGNLAAVADRAPADFRTYCSLPVWALGPCGLWQWSPRSCMEPLIASLTQLDFRSPMEGRATIPSPCHCVSTTRRCAC